MTRAARFDVTTTGETMIRLSVPAGERLERADKLDMYPGGAEANLAVALARMGRRTAWAGGLPANPLALAGEPSARRRCGPGRRGLVGHGAHGDLLRGVRIAAAPHR